MKKFLVTMALCALMAIGATSCKKQSGEALPAATEKGVVRIEKFEGIEHFKNLSGDLLFSVSNGLRSNITITRGEIEINLGDKKIGSLQLTGEVTLPKRVGSSVRVPAALTLSSPIVAYGLITKVVRGEFDKINLTIDADAKIGLINKHVRKENISLQEALKAAGISTDGLKSLVKSK